ncbi:YkgJ family cysteine cluster protein [Pseudomonas akapageensis]|uniref:YkgJ family cysteine cluster protein n=1 Tax=Pseudomonas akapageensis TaxID=2609961 RepID=UPI001409D1E5
MSTKYSCVGCGKCCHDHHVPLTLNESRRWAEDGGTVVVLVEAFLENGFGVPELQLEHARRRSTLVPTGTTRAWLAVTFAAYNAGPCRNLSADNKCAIYERRPLVCRIYPMEINPHIPLRPELKDCPPESWTQGPQLIAGGRLADSELAAIIEQSRQADRDDIRAKAAICARLGISTTAFKGDGFATYLPDRVAFLSAAKEVAEQSVPADNDQEWTFQLADESLALPLQGQGVAIGRSGSEHCNFVPLQRAPE